MAVYVNEMVAGTVSCRVETRVDGRRRLHIAVLAVLAAYRNFGLGSALVRRVLRAAREDTKSGSPIVEAFLHVQVGNDDALRFYASLGFERAPGVFPAHYVGVEPNDALLLRKWLGAEGSAVAWSIKSPTEE